MPRGVEKSARIGVAYAEITGDLTELSKALIQADEKLKRFGRKKAEGHLGLDKKDFDRAAKEGEAKLARLEKKRAQAILDLDTRGIATADAKIEILKEKLEHLHGEVEIDVDRSNLDRLQGLLFGGGRGGGGGKGLFVGLGGTGGSGRLAQMLGGKSLPILTVAALAAEGALAALTAAAIGLGGALAPLVGGLAVLPGVLAGVSQAGFSLFATFSGIGDAVKAAGEATTKSAVDDTAALQQQRAATEAVRSAKEGLSASQRQAQSAQEALTESRKDAVRTLADMKNQAKDAALAEQGSALALREAKAELDRVVVDPKSSQLDIERAQLGIQQARQGAKEARIEAARAKRDSGRAQAGGVDKMPQVVSARQQLAEANRSVTQSTRALSIAQEQAAERTDKLSASDEKLKEAMDKLSPAGRRFVKFLVDLKPAFRSIRDASQEAALPHFQKGIEGAMKNLPVFRQALTNTSRVLGVTAENFGKFAGSKGFGKDFQIIARANNNVMRNLGRALIPLSKAFNDVAVAAAPFTRWIGRAVLHLARLAAHSAKAGREGGGLARFLRRTRTVMEELGKTIGNLVHGLGGLFGAAFPAGKGFLELMTRITEKFDVWANSTKGQNSVAKFLDDAKGPLKDLGDALVSVLKLVKELMLAPGSGATFQLFSRSVKLLADSLSFLARIPGIGGFLANLALMAVIAGRFGRLGAAITGLRELAAGIRGVTAAEGASSGLRGFGLRIRSMLSTLAKTRVGESIAGNISAGLGVGAIKIRRALDSIKGLFRRILARAGIGAGEAAASQAAGGLAASTLPGGKLGRQAGRFKTLGRVFGGALGLGVLAGFAFFIPKILASLKGTGEPQPVQHPQELLQDRSRLTGSPKGRKFPDLQGDTLVVGGARGAGEKKRKEAPVRTKTVEIQTPILSLRASDVRKSMDRIQAVLRRELGQAKRLIERQVGRWDDVFKGFRLLRGSDPLHLGSGIRKSADNAREALRGIVTSLGRVLERLSNLFGTEGREAARALSRGLAGSDVVSRVARMRAEVVSELGKMKRQGSDEARDMVSNLRETFSRLPEVVKRSTSDMLGIVLTAMRALGASGQAKLGAGVKKIEGRAMGGVLPGYSRTDDTLIMARSGEAILTPEQHQPEVNAALGFAKFMGVGRFGSLGEMFQRTGAYAKGGEVQGFAKGGNVRGIVPIPGQPGESIHSSILNQVVSLVRRYKLRVTDGFAPSGHKAGGEHPKGLAIDVIPGAGGSWDRVDKLAAWAEPSQGSPRAPFRWVGYTGDAGHGRGDHLHLSWGGDGGSIVETPRIRATTKGPRGAMRDLVSGAVKKVQGAANRRLGRAEGVLSASGAVGKGGALASSTANQKLGRRLMGRVFKSDQWPALRTLWQGESGWKTTADNPTSSAYGIPQALPGSKMRSAGKDWETNPATQIKWGLRYIKDRYGTPSKALSAWRGRSPHWYAKGGFVSPIQALATGGIAGKPLGFARQIWRKAKPSLGAGGLPMPRIYEAGQVPGQVGLGGSGLDRMTLSAQQVGAMGRHDPYSLLVYLHELAHVFQKRTDEGAAQAWARSVAPKVARSLGINYDKSLGAKDYRHEQRVARKKGREFIAHRQFGLDRRGQPTKATKEVRSLGPWYEHYARGGFVGRGIQAFATGGVVQALAPGGFVSKKKDEKPKGLKKPPRFTGVKHELKPMKTKKKGDSLQARLQRWLPFQVKFLYGLLEKRVHDTIPRIQDEVSSLESIFSLEDGDYYPDERVVPRLQREGHNIQKIGDSFIDWSAVSQRKSEIEQLLGPSFGLIGTPFGFEKGIMEFVKEAIAPLIESVRTLISQLDAEIADLRRQVKKNKDEIVKDERRIDVLTARIDREKDKDDPDEDKLRKWRDERAEKQENVKKLRKENRRLGDDLEERLPIRLNAVDTMLPELLSDQTAFVGASGQGGDFLTQEIDIKKLLKERATLTNERIQESVAPSAADTATQAAQDVKSFVVALTELFKQYGSNIKPIQKFAKGGKVKHSLALVGEEGPELVELPGTKSRRGSPRGLLSKALGALTAPRLMAESGIRAVAERIKPSLAVVGRGGPEIVELPVGSRVRSNPESKRIAKRMGIEGFARGGVIQPSWVPPLKIPAFASGGVITPAERSQTRVEDGQVVLDPKQLKLLIDELRNAKKEVNIDARPEFKEQPTDAHGFSKSLAFELKAAI